MDDGPWALLGEAMVAFVPRPRRQYSRPLPRGIRRVPGPLVVLVERFTDSPVGAYTVFSVAEPSRAGLRIGLHVTTCVVNNAEARRLMRQRWGVPAELGALHWSSEAAKSTMTWDERGICIEARSNRRPFPFGFPISLYQQRSDGPVRIPTRFNALIRPTRVTCSAPEDDMLFHLSGRRPGFKLSNLNVKMRPVKRRRLLVQRSLRRIPEPGIAGMDIRNQLRRARNMFESHRCLGPR